MHHRRKRILSTNHDGSCGDTCKGTVQLSSAELGSHPSPDDSKDSCALLAQECACSTRTSASNGHHCWFEEKEAKHWKKPRTQEVVQEGTRNWVPLSFLSLSLSSSSRGCFARHPIKPFATDSEPHSPRRNLTARVARKFLRPD